MYAIDDEILFVQTSETDEIFYNAESNSSSVALKLFHCKCFGRRFSLAASSFSQSV